LPKYQEFSKSGTSKVAEIWTKKTGDLGQSTFTKPPQPQTVVVSGEELKNYQLGNIPGELWHIKQFSQYK